MTLPPVAYQGGKRRLASAILDTIQPDPGAPFCDLCCGGAAVAMEALRRGHRPELLTLVDAGPWGEVWEDVGRGTFDLFLLRRLLAEVPDPAAGLRVRDHLAWLARQPAPRRVRPAVFLLLQAGSFGGRAIGWEDVNGWRHAGWNTGWTPTATSTRRARNLAFSPSPMTVYERMAALCDALLGARGLHDDVRAVQPDGGVAYLDPPYAGTADYPAGALDPVAYARALPVPCWVSERRPLSSRAVRLPLRHAGGITGGHRASREEWLSRCDGAVHTLAA